MSGTKWMYMGQIVEDGIYMLKDGDLYKCDPRIRFPIAKSVNIVTGKVHYPTNADRIRGMSDEELAKTFYTGCENRAYNDACPVTQELIARGDMALSDEEQDEICLKCWLDWLKSPVEVDE